MAKKQVLVIGGSYFVGRVFSIYCDRGDEFELHVVNRGNAPLNKASIHEYKCDRKNVEQMASILPDIKFDACIDFCAYNKGDIAPIIDKLHDQIAQYIYISTASVYVPGDHGIKHEGDEVMYESDDNMVAQYICAKAQLELELIDKCKEYGIPYTIARPAFIYGPFNYAPRESWYVQKLATGQPIEVLTDGTAHFNFAYVVDVAQALMKFVGDERAFDQIFNIASPEIVTENDFVTKLEEIHGKPIAKIPMSVKEVLANNVAIPWPLEDDEVSDGSKYAQTFDCEYTKLEEGLRKAYNAFWNVYSPQN